MMRALPLRSRLPGAVPAAVCLMLAAAGTRAEPAGEEVLRAAERSAREEVDAKRRDRFASNRELQRLRKDLRFVSEQLDRDALDDKKDLETYSRRGLTRLAEVRRSGNVHEKLSPSLDRLEAMFTALPRQDYAKEYPKGLVRAVAHELRWVADEANDVPDLLGLLERDLAFPGPDPEGARSVETLAFFPVDIPLADFKHLGPIRAFLIKHRLRRPKGCVATTAEAIVDGKHNVEIGAELEGRVRHASRMWGDGDYTFDIGDLHLEITPEWRLSHPGIPKPKKGDRVRVKGWTYYDVFHKAEEEFDSEDEFMGFKRASLWEIHPVQDIEVLP